MKKKFKFGLLSVSLSLLLFAGCESYPGMEDSVQEQLVAVTNYDTSVDFSKFKTFAISDSVTYVDMDSQTFTRKAYKDDAKLQNFADQVKKNLESLGYTAVSTKSNNIDLGINLSAIKSTTVIVNTTPWWYYWDYCYWDWWSCGYYPYYPYSYPYPVVVGGYEVGIASIDMFQVIKGNIGNNNTAKSLWTGAIRGLLDGSHAESQFNGAISDCFNQTVAFQKLNKK